ncbi:MULTISPECIES: hypothetical protein [Rhodococcus]|jgi:hypothetical protein|uniref:Uncharacterized protein n=1 Tax=Rhodococcus qingshengii JCM 15477 TaxID=1303681 RepID=A0AB38RLM5_RHOSG|nr:MULTISPECIES: hypothetical protein [Rhodococcus erythropolis group]MCQ4152502.1 hypothetical protein [Rhodococcus qingshengii]MDV6212590.1 hypothetical protein [Rhodococcus erythropolis]UPU46275.1 hypothetical protein M0639_30465 [Rhodococcus qingshengii JCM 15477]
MTAPDHATTDSLTAVDEQADPRLARSRNRLLDAAAPNFGGVLTCPSRRSRTKVVGWRSGPRPQLPQHLPSIRKI